MNMRIFKGEGGVWTVVIRTTLKNQILNVLPLFHTGHLMVKKSLCFFSA